jgi:hypothetical protein
MIRYGEVCLGVVRSGRAGSGMAWSNLFPSQRLI